MGRFLLCEQIADRQGQLAQDAAHDGGVYILSVEDRAGNVREYRVTIPYEREFSTKNTIIVTFMILLAISGFMIYARRNMRVI